MATYTTNDGDKFEAATALDVVQYLRSTGWTEAKDDAGYMEEMAKRVKAQSGAVVPTNTPELFVAGLLAAEMIKLV